MHKNAIILAAGTSSRFVPLSQEIPKGLLEVKGEILIERQIRQLNEAGISDICLVVGYKAALFEYLRDKYKVELVLNNDYHRYNNTSSLIRVLDRLGNTYICSSDNYFSENVFMKKSAGSYYSACRAEGETDEYCIIADENDMIRNVTVGGKDSWYMVGHVYFSKEFSDAFKEILSSEYADEQSRLRYWEDIYIRYIDRLPPMRINRYEKDCIREFDTLDELREFDSSYITDTRSHVIKRISDILDCPESSLYGFTKVPDKGNYLIFSFRKEDMRFIYDGRTEKITKL